MKLSLTYSDFFSKWTAILSDSARYSDSDIEGSGDTPNEAVANLVENVQEVVDEYVKWIDEAKKNQHSMTRQALEKRIEQIEIYNRDYIDVKCRPDSKEARLSHAEEAWLKDHLKKWLTDNPEPPAPETTRL